MMKNKYRVMIITCWVLLVTAVIVKLCGANIFNIVVNNQNFINACDYIDNHLWLKYILATIVYIPSTYLIYLTMTKQKIGKDLWFILVCLPCSTLKGLNQYIGMAYEIIIILLLIPLLRCKGKNWLLVLIGIAVIILFQQISLWIRNLGFYLEKDYFLLNLIMLIDYYIMVVLYYLHVQYILNRKKGDE